MREALSTILPFLMISRNALRDLLQSPQNHRDAENAYQYKKTIIWSIWFVFLGWNTPNPMNYTNQINLSRPFRESRSAIISKDVLLSSQICGPSKFREAIIVSPQTARLPPQIDSPLV
jgi:hypothetical protein